MLHYVTLYEIYLIFLLFNRLINKSQKNTRQKTGELFNLYDTLLTVLTT